MMKMRVLMMRMIAKVVMIMITNSLMAVSMIMIMAMIRR